ncbi:inverse autotransporter beta domain-containing protein [Xenorhabdus sp. Flor]|uniref:inverse autotransporter beta domain-containing protein n=1 Tax=Xenorhabdus cabanillasii TaxID=351673 RepID=UPI00199E0415|nr:inverse autotransporter beta domain-containing protein [Xenorhabdus sp. Flor]MBD2815998.1 inverse autotransporter beta domain-containing protein [Xenorhabdus sp. Flor]
MLSYISKFIAFLFVIYSLLIPSTVISAFADENLMAESSLPRYTGQKNNVDIRVNDSSKKLLTSNANKKNDTQNTDNIPEHKLPNFIAGNIQIVSNVLSSSPSALVEQAKSYALGKFNSTIASETQKWLSQFGTAKINFAIDRKGRLENNSLDLLLPLYDNKADWLIFSQLGYRNKDSRNTINLGLGGRYFFQNWMYGLNTFYDHDLTGKNKRVGLGGEIWGDYIKLSANAYRRLSDWQISRYFEDHHERPASGYDINGEFFLPAYPNLGGKLSYEQYFGKNVTLFDRNTKQKNPSQVKLGVTYTPIPLITMGVNYKQGEGGRTETQFLANLNYRLGVPLGIQLSPNNVAAMRTLAGERYDLVERNNNIVLDHRKIPIPATDFLMQPEKPKGYTIKDHKLYVEIGTNGTSSKNKVNSEKKSTTGKVLPTDDKFIYTATIIDSNGKTVENEKIPNVKWTLSIKGKHVKKIEEEKHGLHLVRNTETKNGKLTAILTSTKEVDDVLVTLFIDNPVKEDTECTNKIENAGQCAKAEKTVSLKPVSFVIKNLCLVINGKCKDHLEHDDILLGDGEVKNGYKYQATVYKKDSNTPLPDGYIINADWKTNFEPRTYNGNPEWKIKKDNKVKNGKITATLTSQVGIGDFNNGKITDGLITELKVPGDTKPAIPVTFNIKEKEAGIVVYVKDTDNIKIKKSKIFEDQLRPSNLFGNMYAQLYDLSIKKKILDEGGKIITAKGFGINSEYAGSIDMNTGEIALSNFLKKKNDTSITIKRSNKAKYTYLYSFFPKKSFNPSTRHSELMEEDSGINTVSCKDSRIPLLRNVNEFDVGLKGDSIYSLKNEFPDSYDWGLLDYVSSPPPETSNILGVFLQPSITDNTNFIYDTKKNKIADYKNPKGYVLCVESDSIQ